MKKRYTEQQISYALKEVETGKPITEVCGRMGISNVTFYNWRKKFGSMGVSYMVSLLIHNFNVVQIISKLINTRLNIQAVCFFCCILYLKAYVSNGIKAVPSTHSF